MALPLCVHASLRSSCLNHHPAVTRPRLPHTHAHTPVQHFSHPGTVDILRAVRLGAYGFLIDGPVGSKWYDILEKYVYPQEQTSTKAVLAKTALDQVVYATIMTGVCVCGSVGSAGQDQGSC